MESWKVELRVNHGDVALARQDNGTLALTERANGLYFEAHVHDRDWADVLLTASGNRRVWGCSVSWSGGRFGESQLNAAGTRHYTKALLVEVSVLIGKHPAFPGTWASVHREVLSV